MHPIITIFCPFTRRWAIDGWLDNLADVEHDPTLTNLCIIIDCDIPYIENRFKTLAKDKNYRSLQIRMNSGSYPNETNLKIRRQRVVEIHEQAKDLVSKCDGDIIIGLEDDTVFDRMPNFNRLIEPLERHVTGFVEGVQMGRHGARMIGAWQADDIHDPKQIETLLPPGLTGEQLMDSDYQEITGGGWYGFATLKDLFLEAPYFTSPSFPWGPDVNFGFWIRQRGYKCLIDWQTVFGHNDYNITMYPDSPEARLTKIVYNKRQDNGKWERQDYDTNRF
jgi:hypothetical protein